MDDTWQKRWAVNLVKVLPGFVTRLIIYIVKKKYVVGVVAVVFNEEGKWLLLHHTYRKKGAWRLPGGLKERGESPYETAVRELREEAAIRVKPLAILAVTEAYATLDIAVLCEFEAQDPFVANAEVDDFRFLPLAALPADLPKEQLNFLSEAQTWLQARRCVEGQAERLLDT